MLICASLITAISTGTKIRIFGSRPNKPAVAPLPGQLQRKNTRRKYVQAIRRKEIGEVYGKIEHQCAITLEILNTGSSSAIAIVPIIAPRIVIISGSIRAITLLIEASSFFS
jgi:hypothetical protein